MDTSESIQTAKRPDLLLAESIARDYLERARAAVRAHRVTIIELIVLFGWAFFFTLPLLNMDPQVHPAGADYNMTVQFHHVWTRFRECGACFLWNGSLNGGSPAFADLFPSSLHPLVIFTTLGFGVVNGSKVALLGIFFMAGFAQWWLARVIGLGTIARMWSAMMAVAAGNLAGRMQMGWFGVALGTAAAAMVFPPLVQVALTGSRHAALLLGLMLAFAAFAGQGYMQFGLLLLLPCTLILLPWGKLELALVARRYGLAVLVAALVGAPLFLPFIRFYFEYSKAADVNLSGIQALAFIPLSFVVRDPDFYKSEILRMLPYPALYVNYIGLTPMVLALVGVRMARGAKEMRVTIFLLLVAFLAIFFASLEPRSFLLQMFPESGLAWMVKQLRSSPVIAGLAILPILGLAAIGVERLEKKFASQVRVQLDDDGNGARPFFFRLSWLLLIPLVISLVDVQTANQVWLRPERTLPIVERVIQALKTPGVEWVNFPYGEGMYLESAVGNDLKITKYPFAWGWKDRPEFEPILAVETKWAPAAMTEVGRVKGVSGAKLYQGDSTREYAQVSYDAAEPTTCTARGAGGDLDVKCVTTQPGLLQLQENSWAGWSAWIDGARTPIHSSGLLSVDLPAGDHVIQFRYRPWEGILGFILALGGVILVIYLWRKPEDQERLLDA